MLLLVFFKIFLQKFHSFLSYLKTTLYILSITLSDEIIFIFFDNFALGLFSESQTFTTSNFHDLKLLQSQTFYRFAKTQN